MKSDGCTTGWCEIRLRTWPLHPCGGSPPAVWTLKRRKNLLSYHKSCCYLSVGQSLCSHCINYDIPDCFGQLGKNSSSFHIAGTEMCYVGLRAADSDTGGKKFGFRLNIWIPWILFVWNVHEARYFQTVPTQSVSCIKWTQFEVTESVGRCGGRSLVSASVPRTNCSPTRYACIFYSFVIEFKMIYWTRP